MLLGLFDCDPANDGPLCIDVAILGGNEFRNGKKFVLILSRTAE
jgi:hypothetical protein